MKLKFLNSSMLHKLLNIYTHITIKIYLKHAVQRLNLCQSECEQQQSDGVDLCKDVMETGLCKDDGDRSV